MGIELNLDEMKKRLNQLNSKGKTSQYIFKPKPGKTIIRIIPYKYNLSNPFIQLKFHYDFLKQSILSPTSFGRPDPIEQFAEELITSGDKDKWKLGKKIEASMRTFVPIIVREPDDPEKYEFKFWGIGKGIYTQLLNILTDDTLGYGNIIDTDEGRDIILEYIGPKEAGNDYGKISIIVKPVTSKMFKDSKKIKEVINNQPKIEDLYEEKSYEQLKSLLGKFCNADDKTYDVQNNMESKGASASDYTNESSVQEISSDDADETLSKFNAMLNG